MQADWESSPFRSDVNDGLGGNYRWKISLGMGQNEHR